MLCFLGINRSLSFSVSSVFLISATFKKILENSLPCKKNMAIGTSVMLSPLCSQPWVGNSVRKSGSSFLKEIQVKAPHHYSQLLTPPVFIIFSKWTQPFPTSDFIIRRGKKRKQACKHGSLAWRWDIWNGKVASMPVVHIRLYTLIRHQ